MKPDIDNLTAENIVAFIGSIFDRRGGDEYLGEPVTMGEHMLQGATIAERNGQPEEIIVGALLHDMGHSPASLAPSRWTIPRTVTMRMQAPRCWNSSFRPS